MPSHDAGHDAGDIPAYGTGPYGDAGPEDPDDVVRERVAARLTWCLRAMLVALGRDYEHCGKAACARSRRCRGFACEPEEDEEE